MFRWRLAVAAACVLLFGLGAKGDSARNDHRQNTKAFVSVAKEETVARGFLYSRWLDDGEGLYHHSTIAPQHKSESESANENSGAFSTRRFWRRVSDNARGAFGMLAPDAEDLRDEVVRFGNGEKITFGEWRKLRALNALDKFHAGVADAVADAAQKFLQDVSSVRRVEVDVQSPFAGRDGQVAVQAVGEFYAARRGVAGWQLRMFVAEGEAEGGNLGLFRRVEHAGMLWGANAFLDYQREAEGKFLRASIGGEWRASFGDIVFNNYWPLTNKKAIDGGGYAYSRRGFDARFRWHIPNLEWVSARGDYMHWRGRFGQEDEKEFLYGLEFRPGDWNIALRYGGGGKWGVDVKFSHEMNSPPVSSLRRFGRDFDAREHFWDSVRREYGQRISRYRGGGLSGGQGAVSAKDFQLTVYVTSPALTATISPIDGALVISQNVEPFARTVESFRLTLTGGMTLSTGASDSPTNSVIIRGVGANWLLGLQRETRAAFAPELAGIAASKGGGLFEREGARVLSLFAVAADGEVVTMRLVGTRFAFTSTTQAQVSLAEGALSVSLAGANTLTLTADINDGAALYVYGATIATVGCAEGQLRELWNLRAHCALRGGVVDEGVVTIAARRAAVVGSVTLNTEGVTAAVSPAEFALSTSGRTLIVSLTATSLEATMLAAVVSITDSVPLLFTMTVSVAPVLSVFVVAGSATVTAHVLTTMSIGVVESGGGGGAHRYSLIGGEGVSLSGAVLSATLSIAAPRTLTITAAVFDFLNDSATTTITQTIATVNPPPLSAAIENAPAVVAVGVDVFAGNVLVSGGYGAYSLRALSVSGDTPASVTINAEGALMARVLSAGSLSVTIIADDNHPNTEAATVTLSLRAVDRLALGASYARPTVTSHIPSTMALLTLNAAGGGGGYVYSLLAGDARLSLSGVALSGVFSLSAPLSVTATAEVADALSARASLTFTMSVGVVEPPPLLLTVSANGAAVIVNEAVSVGFANAAGGYIGARGSQVGGSYVFGALVDSSAAGASVSGGGVVSLMARRAGLVTATITADDNHPTTPAATAFITLRAVDSLSLSMAAVGATLTSYVEGVVVVASLQAVGGGDSYTYSLANAINGVSLSGRAVSVTASLTAERVLTITALAIDDLQNTATAALTTTIRIIDPPPLTVSVLNVAPIVQVSLELMLTASASGGLVFPTPALPGGKGEYSFGAQTESAKANIGVSGAGVVTLEVLTTGLLTATIIADDDHANTEAATAFITMNAVNELALLPTRANATLTAHIAGAATLATMRAVGGLPPFAFSYDADAVLSIDASVILITLSSSAPTAAVSVFAVTATVTDTRPATAVLAFSLTLHIHTPPPVSLSVAIVNTVILTGAMTEVATVSAAGGYLGGGLANPLNHRYAGEADADVSVVVTGDGNVWISSQSAKTVTATILVDDNHRNTPQATAFITTRAISPLSMSVSLLSVTMTTHIAGAAVFASLRGVGGGDTYGYSLAGASEGVMLNGRALSVTASLLASRALTVTAAVSDNLQNTTTITVTTTVHAIDPPPVSASVANNPGVIETGNVITLSVTAAGGWLRGEDYNYGAQMDGARGAIGVAGVSIVTLSAFATGALVATVLANDDHPNTPQAMAFITLTAVNPLQITPQRTNATLTARIAGVATLATVSAAGGYLQAGEGNVPDYQYGLNGANELSLANNYVVVSLSSAAASATMSVYAVTATITDDRPRTTALAFSVTLHIHTPPPVTVLVLNAQPIVQVSVELTMTAAASGGYLFPPPTPPGGRGEYRFGAQTESAKANIGLSGGGVVTLEVLSIGLLTATIIADDDHANTPQATAFITMNAVNELALLPNRANATLTARIAGTATLATLRSVGGLPPFVYSMSGDAQLSLDASVVIATLSSAAENTTMNVYAVTATVIDARPATSAMTFDLTLQIFSPPSLSLSAAVHNTVILTGAFAEVATVTAVGGLLVDSPTPALPGGKGEYRFSAFVGAGAGITISDDGVVSLSVANTTTVTATITADDDHANTPQATVFITVRAIDALMLSAALFDTTMTTHIAGTAVFASLRGIGGGDTYTYSLAHRIDGVSLNGAVMSLTASLLAPRSLTVSALVFDNLQNTAMITLTTTVRAIDPPPVTVSALTLTAVVEVQIPHTITATASGGWLRDDAYQFGAQAESAKASIGISGVSVITLAAQTSGAFTATLTGDDDHPNTPQATAFITLTAVDALRVTPQRTSATLTARIGGAATLATLIAAGGHLDYVYGLNAANEISLREEFAVVSLSSAAASATMSVYVVTATVTDERPATAAVTFSLTLQIYSPPQITLSAQVGGTVILTGVLTEVATVTAVGGLLVDSPTPALPGGKGEYRFSAFVNAGASITVSDDGVVSLSVANTMTVTATVTADDDHANTPQATVFITVRAIERLSMSVQLFDVTLTTHIAGTAVFASLHGIGGGGIYTYTLAQRVNGVSLSGRGLSLTASLTAARALTITAIVGDDLTNTATLTFATTVRAIDPPPVTASILNVAPIVQVSLVQTLTATAFGGLVFPAPGEYSFGAAADSARANIGVSGVSVVTLEALTTGTLTATITADDDHPNTEQATAFITMNAVNELALLPNRANATLTAHIAGAATLATLRAVGGLPSFAYSMSGDARLSLSAGVIIITLSSAAARTTASVYAVTATVIDARPATSALTFSVTLQIFSPPPVSLSVTVVNAVILTGALVEVATVSAAGGLLRAGEDYDYQRVAHAGANILLASEGVVLFSVASSSTVTATITADDDHPNTPQATAFITVRAINPLMLSAAVFDTTMTTHIDGTAVFASLRGIGGGDTYTYSLAHQIDGVSLNGAVMSLTASLLAPRSLTVSALVFDNLQNTTMITLTTTVRAIDPPPVTVSALTLTAVVETQIPHTITATASGGWLRDDAYQFGAQAESAKAKIGISGVSVITLAAQTSGAFTATLTGDDDHPNTPQATAFITLTAVDALRVTPQRTSATLTARIGGAATLATLIAAGGHLDYVYGLNAANEISLREEFAVVSLSSAATSATMSVYVVTATVTDARPATAAVTFSLTLQIFSPPPVSVSAFVNTAVIETSLQVTITASASGGLLLNPLPMGGGRGREPDSRSAPNVRSNAIVGFPHPNPPPEGEGVNARATESSGGYKFGAFADPARASIGVLSVSVVTLSALVTGTLTATVTADDDHPNTEQATAFITLTAVNAMSLIPQRTRATLTAHIAGAATLVTLSAAGGLPPFAYSFGGDDNLSLQVSLIVITLSSSAPSATMSVYLITVTVIDARPITSALTFAATLEIYSPPQLTLSAAVGDTVILTGALVEVASLSVGGGLLTGGADYSYNAFVKSGASVSVSNEGVVSLSVANTSTITATITADDEHANTPAATVFITIRAIEQLKLSAELFDTTMTTHIAGTAVFASLHRIGGGDTFTYSLTHKPEGASLSGRAISLTASLTASRALTISAIVGDNLQNTATIAFTTTVQAIDPSQVSVSVFVNTAIIETSLQITLTASASGGYLFPTPALPGGKGEYEFGVAADSARASIGISGVSVVTLSALITGSLTATITADDDHPNTEQATAIVTLNAVDKLLVLFERAGRATMTAHIAGTATLATLDSSGGLTRGGVGFGGVYEGLTLALDGGMVITLSSTSPSATLSVFVITASVADARPTMALLTTTLTMQIINPPPLSISVNLGDTLMLAGRTYDIATVTGQGGYLLAGSDYVYGITTNEDVANAGISPQGIASVSVHFTTAGVITATITADDDHANTPAATIFITAKAFSALLVSAVEASVTITNHLPSVTITLATLHSQGGAGGYTYSLQTTTDNASIDASVIYMSISINYAAPTLAPELTVTAIVADASLFVASVTATFSVRAIDPPPITMSHAIGEFAVFGSEAATVFDLGVSVGGGWLREGNAFYDLSIGAIVSMTIADNGTLTSHARTVGTFLITVFADDDNPNTRRAHLVLTADVRQTLTAVALSAYYATAITQTPEHYRITVRADYPLRCVNSARGASNFNLNPLPLGGGRGREPNSRSAPNVRSNAIVGFPHPNPPPEGEGVNLNPLPLGGGRGREPNSRSAPNVRSNAIVGFPHPNPPPEGEGVKNAPSPALPHAASGAGEGVKGAADFTPAANVCQNAEDAGGGVLAKITLGAFGPTITRLSVSSPGNMVRHFTNEDGYPVTATINNSENETGAFIVDLDNVGESSDIAFALLRLRNATAAANMTATMIFTDDTARTVFLPTTLVVEVTAINRLSVSAALPGSVYVSDVGVTVPVASITAWTDDFPVTLSMLSVTPAEFKLSNSVVYYQLQVELQTVTVSIFARDSYAFAHGDFNVPPQTLIHDFTMTAQGRMVAGVMDNIATVFNPRYEGRAAIITARGGVLSEGGAYQFRLMQESEGAFFLNASTTLATMMFNAENEKLYVVTIVVNDYSDPQDELFITMSVWSAKCGFSLGVGCAPLNYDGKMSAEILTAQLAREIITAGANVNARDAGVALRPPVLLRAVHEHAQIPVMSILLTAGANPRGVDEEARTALHYVANRGLPMMTLLLSAAPVLVSARDAEEYMPLHYVAMSGAVLEAMMLLNNGAVRSWPSADETARFGLPFGATPFDAADKGGDLDMINYLRFVDAICLARCRVGDVDAFGVTVMPFNINTGGATLRANTADAMIVTMTVRGGAYTRTRAPFMTLFGGGNFTLAGAGAERTLIHGGMIAEGEYYPVFGVDDNSPYTPFTNITITVKAEVPPPFAAGFDDGISVIRAGHSATVATITANWGIDAVEIVAAQSDAQFTLESMSVIRYRNTNPATATGVFKVVSSADREFGQVTVTISITVGAIDTCQFTRSGVSECGVLLNGGLNADRITNYTTARLLMRAGVLLPPFPMVHAAARNNEYMVRALLEFGVSPNPATESTEEGGYPLNWAGYAANTVMIKTLLDNGARVNTPALSMGTFIPSAQNKTVTPLDMAVAAAAGIPTQQSQAAQSLLVSRGAYCYAECNNANIITGVEAKPQGGLLTGPAQRAFRYGVTGVIGTLGVWEDNYVYSQDWYPANADYASILITNSVIYYNAYDTSPTVDTTLTVAVRKTFPLQPSQSLDLTIIHTRDCRFDMLASVGFACRALNYKGMNNGAGAQIPNMYLALSLVRANAEFTDELGDSVWRAAAQNNALDLARVLLRETNHRAADYVWNSPFNELNDSQTEMFRLLIRAGADVNGTTEIHPVLGFAHNNALSLTVGSTPLDIANLNNRTTIAALLKQNGARCNFNCRDGDLHISPLASRIINEQRIVRANTMVTVGVVEPLARISYQLSLSFGKPDFSLDGSRVLLMNPQAGANTARVVVREQSNDSASFTLAMTITSVLPCDMGVSAARSDSFYRAAGCPALNHSVISESEPARGIAEQLARAGAANYANGGTIYNAWNDVIETNSRALALVMAEQRFSPDDYAIIPPIAAVFLQDYEADFMLDQLLRAGANVNLTTRAQRAVVGRNHAVGSTPLDIVNVQYTDLDRRNRYRAILKSRGARCNTFCFLDDGDISLNVVPEGEVVVYDSISVVRAGHNATIARFAASGVTIAARALSVYPPNAPVSLSVSDMLLARMLVSNAPVAGDITAVYEVLRTPDAGRGMAALTTRFSLTVRAVSQCQFRGAGCPALHHNGVITDAAPNGELAKALIRAGANAGSGANNIWFAAVTMANTHLARELHLHAVNPNHKTTESATPLHFAAYQRNSLMIYYLANTGASMTARLSAPVAALNGDASKGKDSRTNNTPLDMARMGGPETTQVFYDTEKAIKLHGGNLCWHQCRVGDITPQGWLLIDPQADNAAGFGFRAGLFNRGHHGTIAAATSAFAPLQVSVVGGAGMGVSDITIARFLSHNAAIVTGTFAVTNTNPRVRFFTPLTLMVTATATSGECQFYTDGVNRACPDLGHSDPGLAPLANKPGSARELTRLIVRSGARGSDSSKFNFVWTEAARNNNVDIARGLIDENAYDINVPQRPDFPLLWASRIRDTIPSSEMAQLLVEDGGANVNRQARTWIEREDSDGNPGVTILAGSTPLDNANINDDDYGADLSHSQARHEVIALLKRNGGECNVYCRVGDRHISGVVVQGVSVNFSPRTVFRSGFDGNVGVAGSFAGDVSMTLLSGAHFRVENLTGTPREARVRFHHGGNDYGAHVGVLSVRVNARVAEGGTQGASFLFTVTAHALQTCNWRDGCPGLTLPNGAAYRGVANANFPDRRGASELFDTGIRVLPGDDDNHPWFKAVTANNLHLARELNARDVNSYGDGGIMRNATLGSPMHYASYFAATALFREVIVGTGNDFAQRFIIPSAGLPRDVVYGGKTLYAGYTPLDIANERANGADKDAVINLIKTAGGSQRPGYCYYNCRATDTGAHNNQYDPYNTAINPRHYSGTFAGDVVTVTTKFRTNYHGTVAILKNQPFHQLTMGVVSGDGFSIVQGSVIMFSSPSEARRQGVFTVDVGKSKRLLTINVNAGECSFDGDHCAIFGFEGYAANEPTREQARLMLSLGVTAGADKVWIRAAQNGNLGLMEVLQEENAFAVNVDNADYSGSNNNNAPALFYAAFIDEKITSAAFASLLVNVGANVSIVLTRNVVVRNRNTLDGAFIVLAPGSTPLDSANASEFGSQAERVKVRELLRANGARCNLRCLDGDTNLQGETVTIPLVLAAFAAPHTVFRAGHSGLIGTITTRARDVSLSVRLQSGNPFTISTNNHGEVYAQYTGAQLANNTNHTLTFAVDKLAEADDEVFSVTITIRSLRDCSFVSGCQSMPADYITSPYQRIDVDRPDARESSVLLRSGADFGAGVNHAWFKVISTGFEARGPNMILASALAAARISPDVRDERVDRPGQSLPFPNQATPLAYASYLGVAQLVTLMLSAGADANFTITRTAQPYGTRTFRAGHTPLDIVNHDPAPGRNIPNYTYPGGARNTVAVKNALLANGAKCRFNCIEGDPHIDGGNVASFEAGFDITLRTVVAGHNATVGIVTSALSGVSLSYPYMSPNVIGDLRVSGNVALFTRSETSPAGANGLFFHATRLQGDVRYQKVIYVPPFIAAVAQNQCSMHTGCAALGYTSPVSQTNPGGALATMLLRAGAAVIDNSNFKTHVWHEAAQRGNLTLMHALWNNGHRNVNVRKAQFQGSRSAFQPMHEVAYTPPPNAVAVADFLVSVGANINATTQGDITGIEELPTGSTPLDMARWRESVNTQGAAELVAFLKSKGARCNTNCGIGDADLDGVVANPIVGAGFSGLHRVFRHQFDGIIGTLTLSSALPGAVSVSVIMPQTSVDHTLEITNGVTIARVKDNNISGPGSWRQFSFTYRLSSLAGGNDKKFTITIATSQCTFVNDAVIHKASCPAFRTAYGMPLNHVGTISRTYPNAEHASLLVRSGAQAGDNQNNVWMAMVTATDTGGDNFSGFNLTLGQALINANISPNIRDTRTAGTNPGDNFGTPLVYASYLGYYNLVTMLLAAGASINMTLAQPAYTNQTATISIGYTPLDAANMTIVNEQVYLHTWRRPFMIATMKAQNARCNLNCNPGDTNLQGVVQQ